MRRTAHLTSDEAGLAEAAAILNRGGLVAFPTETVYGLGADATNAQAVAGIYAAKERPSFNPLISHLDSFEAAKVQGIFDDTARTLAEALWPGPLTLVVPTASTCTVSDLARAGLDSVGLRVPAHPLAHALLKATGRPVAAPSANRSGRVSPTDADHVLSDLDGRIDAVLDGGASDVGVESTIVACLGGPPRLLRPGGVPREAIEALIGMRLESGAAGEKNPLAPGMLASHYAPRAQVRLNASEIGPNEAALLYGATPPRGVEHAKAMLNLSESGDLREAAAHLFSYLRQLDASGAETIAVGPVPDTGLGEAINDRLRRAAAER
ncbi:threonylcarbamoyl-AMP synthase [Microvirga makkahensis]|uniref:Threonylcarbamoyl-AMP synthase n=2 Tax=Microvirga makkahensis TaxID=1128670 RepID=A0A7X3MU01_9HYPH|nr:L-threonylcarbamoyladenylate synthase [Microvirga makkahensis]MXQ12955.1 threonylcarbamoyl-AMP synthase [Microvirga makkahensis]